MTTQRIALVTGANRGIGFEICKQLAKQPDMKVILTSRDRIKGEDAAQALKSAGLPVVYRHLDITDTVNIKLLKADLEENYGRLDVLVNNAGIYPDEGKSVLDIPTEMLQQAMSVNAIGAFSVTQAVLPLMIQHDYGRVVNVSSGLGAITGMGGYTVAYKMSKAALNAFTRVLANETRRFNIKVNAMCPGWVRTDMGGSAAPRTVEQGADTAVWLATLPDNGPTNGFFRDRQRINW